MSWKDLFSPVNSMDVQSLKEFMSEHEEGTYTLLDVRQPNEYEKGRIPGARLIPLPQLSDRVGELNPDQPVIAY